MNKSLMESFFRSLVIKANQEKFHVEVKVRNSKDSAYNTKVILTPSKNINYVKVEVCFFFRHITFYVNSMNYIKKDIGYIGSVTNI